MSKANNFFKTLKNNPQELIEWAESEIKEYQKFIRLLKKHGATNPTQKLS